MRLLRINNVNVDIDDTTAIGIDIQTYDIKDPAKAKINISNSFSIPKTINNLAIFGLPDNIQSTNTTIYEAAVCDYWIDNEKLIDQAKIRVEAIEDRIELFIYNKSDFWEDIKKDYWPDFIDDLLVWLNSEKGVPISTDPNLGNASDFLGSYLIATEGVVLPFFIGNLGNYISVGQKNIGSQTITGAATGTGALYFTLASGVIIDVPVSSFIAVAPTDGPAVLAQRLAEKLTEFNNITAVYEVSYDTDTVYLTSKEGISDPGLSLTYTSTAPGIPDKTTPVIDQPGIDAGTDFMETVQEVTGSQSLGVIYLKRKTTEEEAIGGHFCIYEKTLFEFIEYQYGVNLLTEGGVLTGNVWDDPVANALFIPIRDLDVHMEDGNNYFQITRDIPFLPLKNQQDKADKTVYDYVVSFMQHLHLIKDELFIGGEKIIRLARFDNLEDIAEVQQFSGRISGTPRFMPRVEGYAQNNLIKFKEIYPEGNELLNSKNIICQNVNLEVNEDLFEIDSYVPSVLEANSQSYSYLGDKESFKTFVRYVSVENTAAEVNILYYVYDGGLTLFNTFDFMKVAELYSLDSEYTFLGEVISHPRFYELKKHLTVSDIRNIEFFKQYYIKELNGSFFINKIKGFNPEKSKEPTILELIKVSNRTPVTPPDLDYFVDGVGNAYVDGELDYYY